MSDEKDKTLAETIDHYTSDLSGKQKQTFMKLFPEELIPALDKTRKKTFASGVSAQQESLHEAYTQDLATIKQGDARGINELKRKFRARGLEIY